MAYTSADIIAEMDAHSFSELTQAQKLYMINDAYYEICSLPYPFLESTFNGAFVAANDIPVITEANGTVNKIIAWVNTTNGYQLLPERLDTITKNYPNRLTDTGQPLYYYNIGSVWHVYPIPSAVSNFTVRYTVTPTELGAASTPLLPRAHCRLITLGALYRGYMLNDDMDIAPFYKKEFDAKLKVIQEDLWRTRFDRTEIITDTGSDYSPWDHYY
jgi:hypothetical protein